MNLKELAKARGTNLKRIAEQCGIPASTLYAISSGETNFDNVGISTFIKIADALGMTPEDLYGRTPADVTALAPAPALTPDERRLLGLYRNMDAAYREMLFKTAVAYEAMTEKDGVGMLVVAQRNA